MNRKKIKVTFVSLGCSKNLMDTEVMLAKLVQAGYQIIPPDEDIDADVIIVNTCAFIESAKKEAIDNILDVAWLKEHRSLKGIVVTGCLAERYQKQIFDEIPEVDAILGVGSIDRIVEAVDAVVSGEKFSAFDDKNTSPLGGERIVTTPEYTAYIKIAEGCNNCCTYCAIPSIRGKFRSRPIEDIVAEAKDLEALGVKELNIVAQDTTRYGQDLYGEYKLVELIRAICDATSIPWIRLLYCYPDKITDALVAEIRDNDRVVKYIDLPIQHISDNVLRKMNRHGDAALIKSVIKKFRDEIPGVCIRTTVIVGFPGETEEDFNELCEYVKEAEFDRLGAFTYSREEDTPAYDFDDQIDEEVKQERYEIIMKLQSHIIQAKNEKLIGKRVRVLCEAFDPVAELYFGRSESDAPDIDTKIYFKNAIGKKRIAPGAFVDVKITEAIDDYDLIGKTVTV
jgi:ribosomal protein S12 methylthiotransferase